MTERVSLSANDVHIWLVFDGELWPRPLHRAWRARVSKNEMAKRMRTSRSQLDRILDPDNDKIQLDTIVRAAQVLGCEVKMEIV